MTDNTPATSSLAAYPSPPEWIAERAADDRRRRRRDGTAENTRRAMESAARIFGTWCQDNGAEWLPAAPETVALFIEEYASGIWIAPGSRTATGASVATIRARIAGINAVHRTYALPAPGSSEIVREAVKALARTKGTAQGQAAPLNDVHMACILDTLDSGARAADTSTRSGDRAQLAAYRDAAIIALAYDLFGRRSEVVALDVEDLDRDKDGSAAAIIRRSKTDQEGKGAHAYVSPDTLRRLDRWMRAASITTGPLFFGIGPNASGNRLDGADVLRIMRRRAVQAGIPNADQITGHSARVGAAQDAIAAGADILSVQQAGRWKGSEMPARYGERLAVKRSASAQLAKAQGRA